METVDTNGMYRRMMWGVLLGGCMIPVGNFQILPMFLGYLMIALSLRSLIREAGGEPYYAKEYRTAMNTMAFSLVVLAGGLIFGIVGVVGSGADLPSMIKGVLLGGSISGVGMDVYPQTLTQILLIIVMLEDALLHGGIASRTARIYRDMGRIAEADRLKKNRMTYVKANLAVIVVRCVYVGGTVLFQVKGISGLYLILMFLNYAVLSGFLILKIWFSMFVYKASNMGISDLGRLAKKAGNRK